MSLIFTRPQDPEEQKSAGLSGCRSLRVPLHPSGTVRERGTGNRTMAGKNTEELRLLLSRQLSATIPKATSKASHGNSVSFLF